MLVQWPRNEPQLSDSVCPLLCNLFLLSHNSMPKRFRLQIQSPCLLVGWKAKFFPTERNGANSMAGKGKEERRGGKETGLKDGGRETK
jgi:hypothetical protein